MLKAKTSTYLNSIYRLIFPGFTASKLTSKQSLKAKVSAWSKDSYRSGFVTENGVSSFVKRHAFRFSDVDVELMLNEYQVMQEFSEAHPITVDNYKVSIPKPAGITKQSNYIEIKSSVAKGRELKMSSPEVKRGVINSLMRADISVNKDSKIFRLTRMRIFLLFHYYFICAAAKDLSNSKTLLAFALNFYLGIIYGLFEPNTETLVHQDMSSDNIIFNKSSRTITLVDLEAVVISDKIFGLSTIPLLYSSEIPLAHLSADIEEKLETVNAKRLFVSYLSFNLVKAYTLHTKRSQVYNEVKHFASQDYNLLKQVIVGRDRTFFDVVNLLTLDFIFKINQWLSLPSKYNTKDFVFCYHSVSKSTNGWKYSIPVREFAKHVDFFANNFNIVTVDSLLTGEATGGRVSLTFDDGYQDVVDNALSLMRSKNVCGSMFILADPTHANRKEMDNDLPLIDRQGVTLLKKTGWVIGSHSMTHCDLATTDPTVLDFEIKHSRVKLEEAYLGKVNYFAYPKGNYTSEAVKVVQNSGYKAAFKVDGGTADVNSQYLIDRISVLSDYDVNKLTALISPLGLFVEKRIFTTLLKAKSAILKKA